MPIPDRRIFHPKDMRPQGIWGIRPSFPGLSPCPGQVAYVLLTSAPVAANSIATIALPLDLHVLSLSLAFILSQDQTLRCCISSFSLSRILMKTQRRFVLRVPASPPDSRRPSDLLCSYLYLSVIGILTWTRDFLFLVSALSISSLQTFQRTKLFRHNRPPEKGVKKIAHAICHIVSRKSDAKV